MRILLVEDEAPLRETLAARLRREGFAVDAASDGEEGLYLGREVPFDIAVMSSMYFLAIWPDRVSCEKCVWIRSLVACPSAYAERAVAAVIAAATPRVLSIFIFSSAVKDSAKGTHQSCFGMPKTVTHHRGASIC